MCNILMTREVHCTCKLPCTITYTLYSHPWLDDSRHCNRLSSGPISFYCPPWSTGTPVCWWDTRWVFQTLLCWWHSAASGGRNKQVSMCCRWWAHSYSIILCIGILSEGIATLKQQGQLRPRSPFRRWKLVTLSEMKGFISAIQNIGIIQVYSYTVEVNGIQVHMQYAHYSCVHCMQVSEIEAYWKNLMD